MDTSLYRIRSLGIVASNKARDSKTVEVLMSEQFPMTDGEVTANAETSTNKGIDADGQSYQVDGTTSTTVEAEWRPIGDSFRQTPPDVRRGDNVIVYQFGDSDKYYWETVGFASNRRLETVRFGINATEDEGATNDATNNYYQEWSSHDKQVMLVSTSMKNGEKAGYLFQFNLKDGLVLLQDTEGNGMMLDSLNKRWLFQNADLSQIDMNGKNITMTAPETWTVNAKTGVMNFEETLDINGVAVNVNAALNLLGNFDLKGDMTTGAGAEGTTGNLILAKNVTILGDAFITGLTKTTDLEVANPPW